MKRLLPSLASAGELAAAAPGTSTATDGSTAPVARSMRSRVALAPVKALAPTVATYVRKTYATLPTMTAAASVLWGSLPTTDNATSSHVGAAPSACPVPCASWPSMGQSAAAGAGMANRRATTTARTSTASSTPAGGYESSMTAPLVWPFRRRPHGSAEAIAGRSSASVANPEDPSGEVGRVELEPPGHAQLERVALARAGVHVVRARAGQVEAGARLLHRDVVPRVVAGHGLAV